MPSLSAKLSRESCMRPSNSSRSRESWITRPEAPMGTGGWADRGLWEACGFAEARFKAVPPSSSREKPRPVERQDGRSRPLHFSTKIGTPSTSSRAGGGGDIVISDGNCYIEEDLHDFQVLKRR